MFKEKTKKMDAANKVAQNENGDWIFDKEIPILMPFTRPLSQ